MRRGSIASLVGIGIIAGGIATAVALTLPWLPKPASKEADRIDPLFWFVIAICIVVFAVVVAVMTYSIMHFRAAPDDDSDGPPIHGHTNLEIIWTLIPTVLVTAIGIVSAVVLSRNDAAGANFLRVNVTAQQFAWSFSYPDAKGLTSGVLRLPKDRSVRPHPARQGRDPFVLGPGVLAEAGHRARASPRRFTSRRTGSARFL